MLLERPRSKITTIIIRSQTWPSTSRHDAVLAVHVAGQALRRGEGHEAEHALRLRAHKVLLAARAQVSAAVLLGGLCGGLCITGCSASALRLAHRAPRADPLYTLCGCCLQTALCCGPTCSTALAARLLSRCKDATDDGEGGGPAKPHQVKGNQPAQGPVQPSTEQAPEPDTVTGWVHSSRQHAGCVAACSPHRHTLLSMPCACSWPSASRRRMQAGRGYLRCSVRCSPRRKHSSRCC